MESPNLNLKKSRQVRMETRRVMRNVAVFPDRASFLRALLGLFMPNDRMRPYLYYLVNSTCVGLSFSFLFPPVPWGFILNVVTLNVTGVNSQEENMGGGEEARRGGTVWDQEAATQKLARSRWRKLSGFSTPGNAASFCCD